MINRILHVGLGLACSVAWLTIFVVAWAALPKGM
jgi:hypothetical protein